MIYMTYIVCFLNEFMMSDCDDDALPIQKAVGH